ncbi:hypothetical protein M513_13910, partial [Trichuris suis]
MSGYTGVHCEYEVGHCEANSCWRNGDCQNVTAFSTFRCHCRWPYSGRHCEYAYQYCKADSCHGHGVCQNLTTGKIRCVCHGGYGGEFCDASVYPIVLPVCMCASVLAALLIVLKYRR